MSCERVASGAAVSDGALGRIVGSGHSLESWVGIKKVFVATLAVLQEHPDPLRQWVPVLGGTGRVGPAFDDALTAFVDQHLPDILLLLPRMMVANDPASGIAMWRAADRFLPPEASLLCVGAAAGLELVADSLEPSLTWRPISRRGVDTAPIDVRDDLSTRWLLAVCPPDDVERFELTRRAIAAARDQHVHVDPEDAVTAIESVSATNPLVVMGASVLCMFDEPRQLIEAVQQRPGVTYLVSDEVVSVHRRSGNGNGLGDRAPGDRAILVQRWETGADPVDLAGRPSG